MTFVNGTTVTGWGVLREDPWHLAGVYSTEAMAQTKAAELGEGYAVHLGENREGSDDFVWPASPELASLAQINAQHRT